MPKEEEITRLVAHYVAETERCYALAIVVELRQLEYQRTTDERFERVLDYMEARETPKQKTFFDGQVYDAFELLVFLVGRAILEP